MPTQVLAIVNKQIFIEEVDEPGLGRLAELPQWPAWLMMYFASALACSDRSMYAP